MGRITVVGVGQGEGQLTEGVIAALRSEAAVILHTERCLCAAWLRAEGIAYEALDPLYESEEDFDRHAVAAAARVAEAAQAGDVVYAVMDVRDRSVAALLAETPARVIPGPPVEEALFARAVGPTLLLEASDWESFRLQAAQNALVREIDDRGLAGEVKLKLMECYPEDARVYVRQPDGSIARTELYNLDRLKRYDHRTSVFVPACAELTALERWGLDELQRLVERLHGPEGCPWDRTQTHASLRDALIEEAYEVADAIDREDEAALIEELGDVLFDALLHAEVARGHGSFDLRDVTSAIAAKMIARHPHVFGNAESAGLTWQELKKKEYGFKSRAEAMAAVAHALPALKRAGKVLKRAEDEALLNELAGDAPAGETGEEIGAQLLSVTARAVRAGIDAEDALQTALEALIARTAAADAQDLQEIKH